MRITVFGAGGGEVTGSANVAACRRATGGLILRKPISAEHARMPVLLILLIVVSLLVSVSSAHQALPNAPSAQKAKTPTTQAKGTTESGWPRTFTSGPDTFVVYQPQVDKWDGNRVDLYAAVEFKAGKDSPAKYGVVWFQARTEVDKLNRLVTLDQAQLTKVKFPVAPDKGPELTVLIQKKLPGATKTMSLDRLEAALEANDDAVNAVDVKNDPPKVIITPKASLLVLIDGMAQLCEIEGTKLGRLINTRAVLLFENDKKNYYLRVQDWWLQAKDLEGPWFYAKKLPDDMKKAEEYVVSHTQAQTLEGEQQPSLKEAGKKAEIPVAYVVFGPTELIETKGEPQYKPIPGTGLEYAENTNGKFVFSASEAYLIENGAITSPLKNATLIGNGPDVLTKVSMVGNDLQLDEGIGTCGKDGQSVPVGVGIPTLKVDRLTVGGTGG